jgi:hypothetical protein
MFFSLISHGRAPSWSEMMAERTMQAIQICTRLYGKDADRKKEFANCQHDCLSEASEAFRVCVERCRAKAEEFGNCVAREVGPLPRQQY